MAPALEATRSVPIVFVLVPDPVRDRKIAADAGHVAWDMEPLTPTERSRRP